MTTCHDSETGEWKASNMSSKAEQNFFNSFPSPRPQDNKLGIAVLGLLFGLVGIVALLVGQYSTKTNVSGPDSKKVK